MSDTSLDIARRQSIELVADQRLVIERRRDFTVLNIVNPDEYVLLSVQVTEDGPVLQIAGNKLQIKAEGELSIDAEKISIHGRDSMTLTTGGDAKIQADGDLTSSGRIQTINAALGNVNIKANDDVKLNGERVRANCD
ncbi:MAG: hypothetical protein D3908_03945 [Candidatus Electrothrix sp. AUS4]|nr:hypothetical protein [Candidatus Electrothrix sp. AUS4]